VKGAGHDAAETSDVLQGRCMHHSSETQPPGSSPAEGQQRSRWGPNIGKSKAECSEEGRDGREGVLVLG
jgi:hypothetical protein